MVVAQHKRDFAAHGIGDGHAVTTAPELSSASV